MTFLRAGSAGRGPWEPAGFKQLRDAYYASRTRRLELEYRIGRTDMGLGWLARVKAIGYRIHAHQ